MRNASKRMGKKGTLTIPQHIRHELGLDGGTAVDLTPTGDGGLVIQKHRPTCNIWLDFRACNKLIEVLKGYVNNAKRGGGRG